MLSIREKNESEDAYDDWLDVDSNAFDDAVDARSTCDLCLGYRVGNNALDEQKQDEHANNATCATTGLASEV